jgi:acylphosphatase
MNQVATLVFRGRFSTESFLEFVRHRAERLALHAGIGTVTPDRIEVCVAGDEALLDAFELACSLGPIDCLVLDHRRLRTIESQASAGVPRSGS